MKILVTGGAGFIGSHLTDALLEEGHEVTVMDNLVNGKLENLSEANKYETFKFVEDDILDPTICQQLSQEKDVVYHLACLGVRHSIHSPFENHQVNAEGTLNLLQAARSNNVKKFFYISSSEVYGKVKSFPITENDVPEPITVYGSSKLVGEHYSKSFYECYKLDTTVLRIFNNYGPRAHYEGDAGEVIPRTIVKLLYGEKPIIFGDGSVTRDFFYVKDTAKLLCSLLNSSNITAETINIGTGEEITIKHLIESLIELMPAYKQIIDYKADRPADVPRLWVDNRKMKDSINFTAGYSFEEGLKETIEFYTTLMQEKNLLEEVEDINWIKS